MKKVRKISAIVLIVIGAVVFLFALYAKMRVSEAKKNISQASGVFHNNPVNKRIGEALEKKVGDYDAPIMIALIGGVILVAVGVGTFFFSRRR